ncbi:uncharacterized protein LOC120339194 [Styela clava]
MENVTEGGDAAQPVTEPESRKSQIRSADVDETNDPTIPKKVRRLTDEELADQIIEDDAELEANERAEEAELKGPSANEVFQGAEQTLIPINEVDSDVDLGEDNFEGMDGKDVEGEEDEEQLDLEGDYAGESDQPAVEEFEDGDFDEEGEGDIYDEEDELGTTAEETEDNIQEEADSSTELHDFVQANLAYIEDCQSDIDTLNHKANEEILLVELKYNRLRLPVYKRRNTYIERVPHFWATVFSQHRQLRQVLTKEDLKCLKYVTKLQVEDFEENRSGYSIQFYFSENPWFENRAITKEYHLPWHGSPSCSCTPIQWKKGMNLPMKSSSFFSWFTSQEDASADDIAEIIKDDLWPNPLQCFLMSNKQADESESDDPDDSGNLNKDDSVVLLDDSRDDDVEYISSDEEEVEWQGDKGQTSSTHYLVQDDEEEEQDDDEYDEFDEEDEELDVTGTSGGMGSQPRNMQLQDRRPKGEVINIDDDYLESDEEEEYYQENDDDLGVTDDPDNDKRLLQGQEANDDDFEIIDPEAELGDSPKNAEKPGGGEATGVQNVDSNHDTGTNEDSRHSNGVVGSSTKDGGEDEIGTVETPSVNENSKIAATKMQEQSKVVSTTTAAGDADVTAGAT